MSAHGREHIKIPKGRIDICAANPQAKAGLLAIAALGLLALAYGFFATPKVAWHSLLLGGYFLVTMGVSGVFLVAVAYICHAVWPVAIRRVPEAFFSSLLAGALVMLAVLAGVHSIYEWSHANVVAHDELLQSKAAWLNVKGFSLRTIFYLLLWIGFGAALIRNSRKQDEDGDVARTKRNISLSAIFLFLFAFSFSASTFDWVMSLEPHWFSTIYGIYGFSGMFLSGCAAVALVVILLRRKGGPLEHVATESHLHDIGKLVFAFSSFWMYIWFSNYMLIWYTNMPEETSYFFHRLHGGWGKLFWLNVIVNWVIPFFVLLPAKNKKNPRILGSVSALVLLGRFLDLYLMIMPSAGAGARPGVAVFGAGLASLAIFFIVVLRTISTRNIVPSRDPRFKESLRYHS